MFLFLDDQYLDHRNKARQKDKKQQEVGISADDDVSANSAVTAAIVESVEENVSHASTLEAHASTGIVKLVGSPLPTLRTARHHHKAYEDYCAQQQQTHSHSSSHSEHHPPYYCSTTTSIAASTSDSADENSLLNSQKTYVIRSNHRNHDNREVLSCEWW